MTMRRYIPASQALVYERPGGALIEIPDDAATVVEWHCDVATACNGEARPRVEHQISMTVDGPGYPATRVEFSACKDCCRSVVPNGVRSVLASFGLDMPPGLMPD